MSTQLALLVLLASIIFEVAGMVFVKHSNGYTNILPLSCAIVSLILSMVTFSISLKHIEMGISYAIWASVSTAALALIGMIFYAESVSTIKIISIAIIIFGVVLLNLTAK